MPGPALSFAQPLSLAALAATLSGGEPPRLPPAPAAAGLPADPAAAHQAAHWLLAHACGTGPEVPPELVRRLLLLKAHGLGLENSVNMLIIKRLLDFYNRDVWPVIYEQGAMETPLAHLALPLLGLGEVNYQGYRLAAADVLGLFGWEPLALTMPESRALLAGEAFALAYATEALERAAQVLRADAALSKAESAVNFGFAALAETGRIIEAACNAPAQTADLFLAFKQLATTLAAVGQASAQRTGSLLAAPGAADAAAGLSLAALPAVAASLAAASQRLAVPAAPAPAEVRRVVENTEQLLGLELLAAAQQLDERGEAPGGPTGSAAVAAFRAVVTFAGPDQLLAPGLHRAARFVREYEWA